jgi:hypothetical protein
MMSSGAVFLVSLGAFIVYAFITRQEQVLGRRFLLDTTRTTLDEWFLRFSVAMSDRVRRIVRHTIKLSWYYSIHKALRVLLLGIVALYDKLELVFINNRERAKVLRAEQRALGERNHLTEISEHKASTALSPKEKKKLRARKLAGE